MATFKWSASWTSRVTMLATELNSLADNAYSGISGSGTGVEFDNTTNVDVWARFVVNLASLNPTGTAFITVYLVKADSSSNYEDAPSSTLAGYDHEPVILFVSTGSAAKRRISYPFKISPGKYKAALRNDTNVSLAASGSTVAIETADRGSV